MSRVLKKILVHPITIYFTLFVLFLFLYTNPDWFDRAPATNLFCFDFYFNADPLHYLYTDFLGVDPDNPRHPTFAILNFIPITLLKTTFGKSVALYLYSPLIGAAGNCICFMYFKKRFGNFEAIVFTLLYGCATAVWVFNSIPSYHALSNLMGILLFYGFLHFLENPPTRKSAAVAMLYIAASFGISIFSIATSAQAVLAYGLSKRLSVQPLLALGAKLILGSAVIYGAFEIAQTYILGGDFSYFKQLFLKRDLFVAHKFGAIDFFRVDNISLQLAVGIREFWIHSIIAPSAVIDGVNWIDEPFQMAMIRPTGSGFITYFPALVALGLTLLVFSRKLCEKTWRDETLWLAIGIILLTVAVFSFWQVDKNFFMTNLAVFPIVVVLSRLYEHSQSSRVAKRAVLVVFTLLVIANSSFFVHEISGFITVKGPVLNPNRCQGESPLSKIINSAFDKGVPIFCCYRLDDKTGQSIERSESWNLSIQNSAGGRGS